MAEGKGLRRLISPLLLKAGKIYGSPIQPGAGTGFQTSQGKTKPQQTFG
jgi:hypothetical protein